MKGDSTASPKQHLTFLTIRKFFLVSSPHPSCYRLSQFFLPWSSLQAGTDLHSDTPGWLKVNHPKDAFLCCQFPATQQGREAQPWVGLWEESAFL